MRRLLLSLGLGWGVLAICPPALAQNTPQTQLINTQLAKSWEANNLKPSARADDFEFIRRVYLDLIGRIARPEEVIAFQSDTRRDKRHHLIQKLLNDPAYVKEYAKHWSNVWTVWLLTRSGDPVYHEQTADWLDEQFRKNVSHKQMVTDLLTATGANNDNGAVNFILSHLGERVPNDKQKSEGYFDMVPITSRTTRLFLGLQTQCVQCHDHPFNPEWKQQAFWGANVFFRQVARDGTPTVRDGNNRMVGGAKLTLRDEPDVNADGLVYYERRNGMILPSLPIFLDDDSTKLQLSGSKTRRQQLAEHVTKHPNFAKAYVNRVWAMLFGRSLNEQPAADDFGEHNKVVHPELLDKLAEDFIAYDYNPKELLTWICNSDAYNLTSVANSTNDKSETDVFFSRMLLKAMSPEQMLDSLLVATLGEELKSKSRDEQRIKDIRTRWMNTLVKNFGDDEGNEVSFNGTIVQALLMMNGADLNAQLRLGIDPYDYAKMERMAERGAKTKGKAKGKSPPPVTVAKGNLLRIYEKRNGEIGRIIDDLYLTALNRYPSGREKQAILGVSRKYGADPTFCADVFWAVLNSNEFLLNH